MTSEVMLIGGQSGAGKTSVGLEVHAQLSVAGVAHCLIDGDFLDLAFPPPWEHDLAERNLAVMWQNYRALGHHRLIYTNTVSVLPEIVAQPTAAMGDHPDVVAILLTCTDDTARRRLAKREIGSTLDAHLASSEAASARLRSGVVKSAHRVCTDDRTVTEVAAHVIALAGWRPAHREVE